MAASFDITMKVQKALLDVSKIQHGVDKEKRRATIKGLAFVRKRARSSLRRRKKASEPGSPPSVHAKGRGLKTILFEYDNRTGGGRVGPVKLDGTNRLVINEKTAASTQEFGGKVRLRQRQRKGRKRQPPRTVRYKPRPFMGPALEKEVEEGNIASPWANVVGG